MDSDPEHYEDRSYQTQILADGLERIAVAVEALNNKLIELAKQVEKLTKQTKMNG